MEKRLWGAIALTLVAAGCSHIIPSGDKPGDATTVKQEPFTKAKVLVTISDEIEEAKSLASKAKDKFADGSPQRKRAEELYRDVARAGGKYTGAVALLLKANKWDDGEIRARAHQLGDATRNLRAYVGDTVGGNDLSAIVIFLVDFGFRIYDEYSKRTKAERDELAALVSEQKWPAWETIAKVSAVDSLFSLTSTGGARWEAKSAARSDECVPPSP